MIRVCRDRFLRPQNFSAFDRPHLNAVDQLTLEDEEDDRAGNKHIHTRRHAHVRELAGNRRAFEQVVNAERKRILRFVVQIQQRCRNIIPYARTRSDQPLDDNGFAQGEIEAEKNVSTVGSVVG